MLATVGTLTVVVTLASVTFGQLANIVGVPLPRPLTLLVSLIAVVVVVVVVVAITPLPFIVGHRQ